MTRKEQIETFANAKAVEFELGERFKDAIKLGAEWADANVSDEVVDVAAKQIVEIKAKLAIAIEIIEKHVEKCGMGFQDEEALAELKAK